VSFSWSGLHARLLSATLRRRFHFQLQSLRTRYPALATFADAADLLRHQHGARASAEARNAALHALVEAMQDRDSPSDTAQILLILSLWPGLDAARTRLRRRWRGAEIDADLVADLVDAAGRLDLAAVTRVAATLLRNVERDLGRSLVRQAIRRAHTLSLETIDGDEGMTMPGQSLPDKPWAGAEAALDARRLPDRLAGILGNDAALVLAVLVEGRSQAEAGAAMGLGSEASRKRFQRAVARLRGAADRLC
jgi:RNA polymerase sigma-70 factor (ECF subfamily)